jgi:hypothetical protein
MNGLRQSSMGRNLSVTTSTINEIAARLIRRFEHADGRVELSRERHMAHALVAAQVRRVRCRRDSVL